MKQGYRVTKRDLLQISAITGTLAVVAFVALIGFVIPVDRKADELAQSSRSVTGTEIRTHAIRGEGLVSDYTYTVDGREYSGTSLLADHPTAGRDVVVYYLATDPGFSSLNPAGTAKNFKSQVVGPVIWIIAMIAIPIILRVLYYKPDMGNER